ncbi:phenoloxidase-activating factor 3-like [Drosophila takahashii]|uniref:phenoloxidase-activating factor 3-like n=1 Tax=Drosophila takahashii TaxID=29030 RepID=UPI001CF92AEB|nr:phenoloxidase-activating factor 3-like [Drosophila takahashii]
MEVIVSGKLVQLLILSWLGALALAEPQCGRLDENLLYTTNEDTIPSENPWIGLLLEDEGNSFKKMECNVVIINELHVLTTATCVKGFRNRSGDTGAVALLGVWNEEHSPDEELVCNDNGFCVPGPEAYKVVDIKVHPQRDRDTGDNDLAVLRLAKPIEWTFWIQPICMEGSSEPETLTNRNLHYSGFNGGGYNRGKGLAMTVSTRKCKQLTSSTVFFPANQMCGYPVTRTKFYPGAPLMDIDVRKEKPHSFYLVAILVRNVDTDATTQVYQNVRRARSWIKENTK